MIKGALEILLTLFFFTWLGLVAQRMILLFFPAMTVLACTLKLASFVIPSNEVLSLPIFTQNEWIIVKNVRFSSEILPIMSIITLGFVMFIKVRTPLSFKVIEIIVHVFFHFVQKSGLHFFFGMSKWTIVKIFTFFKSFGIKIAILCLILFNVIVSFHFIVWLSAFILLRTLVCFFVRTQFWVIVPICSSAIFNRMVKPAMFVVVLLGVKTLLKLKLV